MLIVTDAPTRNKTTSKTWVLLLLLVLFSNITYAADNSLPQLGDCSSGIISPEKEYTIGRAWLRQLRSQAPTISDPLLTNYLNHLLQFLGSNSMLIEPNLELVVLNSPQINAFAVPGGVIGLNAGLLIHAQNEDELAAVISHELAHLSQRHFARGVEFSKQNNWKNLAALMASVVILAAAGSDAGIAAIATTQAAAIDQQLRFSRQNEREADRIGIKTLATAGMSPAAMPDFFDKLLKSTRYAGIKPPEFLLTHPVTQNRIADARNRIRQLPAHSISTNLEFLLMKARTTVEYSKDRNSIIKLFKDNIQQKTSQNIEDTRYGLACAYQEVNRFDDALEVINDLLQKRPEYITYLVTKLEILNSAGQSAPAATLGRQAIKINPGNFPLSIAYAEALTRTKQPSKAINILKMQLEHHSSTPYLWFMLSEAYGKNGDIISVHESRAEYYFLNGRLDRALEQLRFGLASPHKNFAANARLLNRMKSMQDSRSDLKL